MICFLPPVAFPDMSVPSSRTFYSNIWETSPLDCSIPPGKLINQYSVEWIDATNNTNKFYVLHPPYQQRRTERKSERYDLDPNTFQLMIRDVQLSDGINPYLCILHVTDIMSGDETPNTYTYGQTTTAKQFLSVFGKFCI